jgi:hypothetical protein
MSPRQAGRSKIRAKLRNDVILDNALDTVQHSNRRPVAGLSESVREQYLNMRLELHLHALASVYVNESITGDFCLCYKSRADGPFNKLLADVLAVREGGSLKVAHSDQNTSVLIDVLQLIEKPERMERGVIPSVVRLQSLDDCLRAWAMYLIRPTPRLLKPSSVIKIGKLLSVASASVKSERFLSDKA